ncbi:enoyl-CoA hydratase/isomerase family protein [Variovorax sp. J2P1-59]|uniref:enoyl-CoA hydratase/isomerase family protein n=1 Tax=Variovorax flavidus TaxID=3053501 RepID=UPI0025755ACE|nr:enoyl-CoA hydratase/isomerase family protein [Variovorax sp. J2P1-59]MDM0078430.1 enoyl-CoA hydratase/isomerase family protein [Variovorax sp. J2P1-59]
MEFETLRTRSDGRVLFAEIDSAPINLLGTSMVRDLVSLIRMLDSGDNYRVVVFSSANPQFFIPHVDVTEVQEYRREAAELAGEASLGLLLRRLSTTRAVTIAQIDGRVRGAGSEFVLACDMQFASREHAVFAQPEAGVGLVPGAGGVQHLARAMGRGRALEVLLSADDYDADLAERYGWINRAMPAADLPQFVASIARRIANFPQQALEDIKGRVNAITLADTADFRIDSDLFGAAMRNPVVMRRMQALLARGMQTPGDLEHNFGRELTNLPE